MPCKLPPIQTRRVTDEHPDEETTHRSGKLVHVWMIIAKDDGQNYSILVDVNGRPRIDGQIFFVGFHSMLGPLLSRICARTAQKLVVIEVYVTNDDCRSEKNDLMRRVRTHRIAKQRIAIFWPNL